MFMTTMNAYITPKEFSYLNLLSLAFPGLVISYVILTVIWIFIFRKRAFFFFVLLLCFLNPITRWFNFSTQENKSETIKVITWNIHNTGYEQKHIINKYLQDYDCDIIMLQETGLYINMPKLQFKNEILDYFLVSFYTKHKVFGYGEILNYMNENAANAMYVDLEIRGKKMRFINVYLNSFVLNKKKIDASEGMSDNKKNAKYLLKRLLPNFVKHQESIKKIRPYIENSPYPVIVGGDFNAVPNSFEYYEMSKGLKDFFTESGNGLGTTFHDIKVPIRIDYLLGTKDFEAVSYKVDRNIHVSDHYPVVAEIKLAE